MKSSELRKLNDEDLQNETEKLRRELFNLRSQAVTEKLENPCALSGVRRDIARALTEKRARTLQEK